MAYPTIQILPNAQAGTATATDFKTMYQKDQFGTFDLHFGELKATPKPGWAFDHFEWEMKYVTTKPEGDETTYFQYSSTSNPYQSTYFVWKSPDYSPPYDTIKGTDTYTHYLYYGSWNYSHIFIEPNYRFLPCVITITYIKAVFKEVHIGTGKILYYPSNNKIIYGSRGTILYDD